MLDLHIHTTFSDGQYTPEEVVKLAADAGITTMAITDHDTVSGVNRGAAAAEAAGIRFISGIEISCKGNRELHILGYNIDCDNKNLTIACADFAWYRDERALKIIEYLQKKNIIITIDDVNAVADHITLIGRQHFAMALVNKGYVKTTREAFDKYLGTSEFDAVERPKPSPEEGINMILDAGGLPVLAHPALLKLQEKEMERLIVNLISFGLCGIECYYSLHTASQISYYCSLAEKYGLLITGGSDFHGEKIKPDIKIGTGVNGSLFFDDHTIINLLSKGDDVL